MSGREPFSLSAAEIALAVRELQDRVDALEQADAHPARQLRPGPDLGLIEALGRLTEPAPAEGGPAGTLTYAGVADIGGERLAWQMRHAVPGVLALDESRVARQLAAIASPVRLRILHELAHGPLQAHELQARLDGPSTGQLYHHLRELLASGLVTQPRRSIYEVPARAVIPLLTLIACADDLATGSPDEVRETP